MVVLITGATRGLGRALVDRFVEAGWTVVGCGRSQEQIELLTARYPAPHRFHALDVTDVTAVNQWAESVLDSLGPPDLLLNNAALINANAPLWEIGVDDFHRVIDVNINGVFHIIRAYVPAMVHRAQGVIVNFSSGWGRSTSPDVAPYCATKWAMEGLSQALADELPRGMASVALNPGIIDTDMLRSCFGEGASQYPNADAWSRSAIGFLMKLGPGDNGRSLTAPVA